ncbi:MAG: hypothetical protein PHQ36_11495, partial [Anaerolineales bacterium]|nr:hypothetical protein [Anaerolineales bacterium]
MDGSLFCADCGSQLAGKGTITTQNISTSDFKKIGGDVSGSDRYQTFNGEDAWGSLHLLDTGQVIPLTTKNEFTLGRVSEGQPIMPD